MNEQQRIAFAALCVEWDTVIRRRCALLKSVRALHPDMTRADLYRETMDARCQVLPSQTITNAARDAFVGDITQLKQGLLARGYYSAAWDLED